MSALHDTCVSVNLLLLLTSQQQALLLTSMYMMNEDRPQNFLLDEVPEQLPSYMQVDGSNNSNSKAGSVVSCASVIAASIKKNQDMVENMQTFQQKLLDKLDELDRGGAKGSIDHCLKVLRGLEECDTVLKKIAKEDERAPMYDSDDTSEEAKKYRKRKKRMEMTRQKYLELENNLLDS